MEVMIERKRHFNVKLFHYDLACAIRETPILIFELLKYIPRERQIAACDLMDVRKTVLEKSRTQQ